MVTMEAVTINVPVGMSKYLTSVNSETEIIRNALLLYPYILNQTISHGRAAEILGIMKSELIDIYDKLGYSYLDKTMDSLESELALFRQPFLKIGHGNYWYTYGGLRETGADICRSKRMY